MSDFASHLAALRDPRLAALATSAAPAWLWSTDATRILWANAVGAAIFGLASPGELAARRFEPRDQVAAQIARLLGSLRLGGRCPPRAPARLRHRRLAGADLRLLAHHARRSHHRRARGRDGAGRSRAHRSPERVRRLYDGSGLGVAVFAPDGSLVHATPQARRRLGGSRDARGARCRPARRRRGRRAAARRANRARSRLHRAPRHRRDDRSCGNHLGGPAAAPPAAHRSRPSPLRQSRRRSLRNRRRKWSRRRPCRPRRLFPKRRRSRPTCRTPPRPLHRR